MKSVSAVPSENESQRIWTDFEYEQELWLPGRPALQVKGVNVLFDLDGAGKPVWDFGEGDQLGGIRLIALDDQRHPVDTSAEKLFPSECEEDPEYKLLLRYVDVADVETFRIVSELAEPVREATGVIGDYVVQRPLVPDISHALQFAPDACRIWRSGGSWNGVTRLGEAVADGLLSTEEYDRIVPGVEAFLRSSALEAALERALEPFPDRAELLERIHELPLFDGAAEVG